LSLAVEAVAEVSLKVQVVEQEALEQTTQAQLLVQEVYLYQLQGFQSQ
tara:strand:+ start:52 stop:195 length:144 start_codon:yes stop_codon:yes gene_type:complete